MYKPETIIKGNYENLPEGMLIINEDTLNYQGEVRKKNVLPQGIREEGPDAWAGFLQIPQGAWSRRIEENGSIRYDWIKTNREQRVYIEEAGCGVEYIWINDGSVRWVEAIGYLM